MPKLLIEVKTAPPCQKLNKLIEVLGEIYTKTSSHDQTLYIHKWLDQVREHLEQAKMTYMASAPPSPEIVEEHKVYWKNLQTLFKEYPIIWIVVNGNEVINVMFATLDMRNTWSLFQDHFTLTNIPPMSSPQYSKGQWVFYEMQNHVQDPNMLLAYVPIEYAGHELLVLIEEREETLI